MDMWTLGLAITSVGGLLITGGLILYSLSFYELKEKFCQLEATTATDLNSIEEVIHAIKRNSKLARKIEYVMVFGAIMAIAGITLMLISD